LQACFIGNVWEQNNPESRDGNTKFEKCKGPFSGGARKLPLVKTPVDGDEKNAPLSFLRWWLFGGNLI
jgi:hypothetical protein